MQHQEGEFVTHDNTSLFYQAWLPDAKPKVVIIYLHGALAHSGEGRFVGERLSGYNAAVYAMDQRGWGRSYPDKPGHIKHRQETIDDVTSFFDFVTSQEGNDGCPIVLMGHSMGGLLGLRTLIDHQDRFICGVFSSPWIAHRQKAPAYARIFGPLLSKIWPTFSDDPNVKIDELTHDNKVINQHYRDLEQGLRKNKVTVRWFDEILKTQKEVVNGAELITIPTIIMQAGQDLIVAEGASKDIYNALGSQKKEWQYYERSYHEVWTESDRDGHIDEAWEFIEEVLGLE